MGAEHGLEVVHHARQGQSGHARGGEPGLIQPKSSVGIELVLEKGLLTEEELDQILSVENLMRPEYRGKMKGK